MLESSHPASLTIAAEQTIKLAAIARSGIDAGQAAGARAQRDRLVPKPLSNFATSRRCLIQIKGRRPGAGYVLRCNAVVWGHPQCQDRERKNGLPLPT
jgi:hypothetical protein